MPSSHLHPKWCTCFLLRKAPLSSVVRSEDGRQGHMREVVVRLAVLSTNWERRNNEWIAGYTRELNTLDEEDRSYENIRDGCLRYIYILNDDKHTSDIPCVATVQSLLPSMISTVCFFLAIYYKYIKHCIFFLAIYYKYIKHCVWI